MLLVDFKRSRLIAMNAHNTVALHNNFSIIHQI